MKIIAIIILSVLLHSCKEDKQGESLKEPSEVKYITSIKGANLREGAGLQTKIILSIPFGEKIEILSKEYPEWYKVKYKENYGYIHISLLGESSEAANKISESRAYEDEITKAKDVNNRMREYVFISQKAEKADCLFGGGTGSFTIVNNADKNIDYIFVLTEVRGPNGGLKEKIKNEIQNLPAHSEKIVNISFQRGCQITPTILCIRSNYYGYDDCNNREIYKYLQTP